MTQTWDGAKLQTCSQCGKLFAYYTPQAPKLCPRCKDIEQKRPTICIKRQCLHQWHGVKIVSLPGKWAEKHSGVHTDSECYYRGVKGSAYGARWRGRIDIYANAPFEEGDIVTVREMETVHLVKKLVYSKPNIYGGVNVYRRNVHYFDPPEPGEGQEIEEVQETRRYLYLAKSNMEEQCRLVYATAHTKTTLKGLGRQYYADVLGAPLAKWEVYGGARSGRYYTIGVLAIVDEQHPLVIITRGDIKDREEYV